VPLTCCCPRHCCSPSVSLACHSPAAARAPAALPLCLSRATHLLLPAPLLLSRRALRASAGGVVLAALAAVGEHLVQWHASGPSAIEQAASVAGGVNTTHLIRVGHLLETGLCFRFRCTLMPVWVPLEPTPNNPNLKPTHSVAPGEKQTHMRSLTCNAFMR
jgi:hypothetical protein